MTLVIKVIWVTAIVVTSISMIWYLLGSTAGFQRGIDLVMTTIYIAIWVPALIFTAASIVLLKKGWQPSNIYAQIFLAIALIAISVFFYFNLFCAVHARGYTVGWLTESVRSDYTQITSDGKYEYRLEIINAFQRNSTARLYVKDMFVGEEMTIPVSANTKNIGVIMGGVGSRTPEPEVLPVWSELTPSETVSVYILATTEHFERMSKNPTEIFNIDMEARTSYRIE